MKYTIAAFSVAVALIVGAVAQEARADDPVPVNADNFVRAESDLYFGNVIKDAGGVGTLLHHRDMGDIARQSVIRLNRDTLYSAIVLDLEAGPATITLPDAGERFMSLQVINEDQYTTELHYGGGSYPLSKDSVGTRYVLAGVRTLANPNDPADLAAVHALQMPSRSSSRAARERSRYRPGTRRARTRRARRCSRWRTGCPTPRRCSVPRIRSTRCGG